ncbi:MAG: hypothetical protein CTY35_03505 [Methylotenera sp.]|nr:MAG: hypothetical protein CTY35_03505 [Methylotenera sp.]
MANLFDIQPERNDPIEFTHFDCWFWDDNDSDGYLHERFQNIDDVADMTLDILSAWDVSLGTHIVNQLTHDFGSAQNAAKTMGFDNVWSLAVLIVLRAGYDVFEGSTFIEIYAEDDYVAV